MKFIDEYQYSELNESPRLSSTTVVVKDVEMKANKNVFKDSHVILSTDVVTDVVTDCKFRVEFIDDEDLSVETRNFRDILLEELERNLDSFTSAETQTQWLRNIRMKFASGFGKSSSKKGTANIWPIALISPENVELFKRFRDLFILVSSQPNDGELSEHIRAEYKNRCNKSQIVLATDYATALRP